MNKVNELETEVIDKLFLELSQVTKATTARELMLQSAYRELKTQHELTKNLPQCTLEELRRSIAILKGSKDITANGKRRLTYLKRVMKGREALCKKACRPWKWFPKSMCAEGGLK